MPLSDGRKAFYDFRIRFDTKRECDGQTDGRTDGFTITISRCTYTGMLTRDKNARTLTSTELRVDYMKVTQTSSDTQSYIKECTSHKSQVTFSDVNKTKFLRPRPRPPE